MRRMSPAVLALACVSLCLMVSSGFAAEKAIGLSKQYKWKMVSFFPPGHSQNQSLVEFIELLKQRTGGKLQIDFYESSLGAPADYWEMLKGNAVQLAFLSEAYLGARMPVSQLSDLPFEIADPATQREVYAAWLKAGYLRELTDNFKIVLYKAPSVQYLFTATKKVERLEDFRGLKIRAPGSLMGQVITALGAAGVSMTAGETYLALQTGVVDGTITGADQVVDRKFYEPCKLALKLPVSIYSGIWVLGMNRETWNSLPKELQDLIEHTASEVSAKDLKFNEELERKSWEALAKHGMTTYTISAQELERWKKATAGVASRYIAERAGKGYPLEEALTLMRKTVSTQR